MEAVKSNEIIGWVTLASRDTTATRVTLCTKKSITLLVARKVRSIIDECFGKKGADG